MAATRTEQSPTIMVVDNGSLSTGLLAERLEGLGAHVEVVALRVLSPRLPRDGDFDAAVLSGTDVLTSAPDIYDAELELILHADVPILGICGGMHLIARAHGTGIVPGRPAVGKVPVHLADDERLFAGVASPALLFQRHCYELCEVPGGFRRIAWSELCGCEGISHDQRAVYGLQAHLELRPEGAAVLRNFVAIVSARTARG
jgi:GMP synthase-like glutamine amidotransferase